MNTERRAFLDQLAQVVDAGDRQAAAILPAFEPWLMRLLQDNEAAKFEPGSAGYVARMFALRTLADGVA
jgi:hypothetical protein